MDYVTLASIRRIDDKRKGRTGGKGKIEKGN